MDPNETLKEIEHLTNAKAYRERAYIASELSGWLQKGGFQPDWNQCPKATKYFKETYPRIGIKEGIS